MTKKFEKITLITCIDTYGSTVAAGMTALDELVDLIAKHATEVTLIDYDLEGEYELRRLPGSRVKKVEEVN
jgi:predicted metal-dependent peptidase